MRITMPILLLVFFFAGIFFIPKYGKKMAIVTGALLLIIGIIMAQWGMLTVTIFIGPGME